MKDFLSNLLGTILVLFLIALGVFVLAGITARPTYEIQDAKVIHVRGSDDLLDGWRTLVVFADGHEEYARGNLGREGDKVRAPRMIGTSTTFGVFDIPEKKD